MSVTAEKSAPYAPASAIMDLIERLRTRGLPSPVTADVLARAGVSESLVPRTLQALQVLDLLDEQGMHSKTLEGIRLAPEGEYKQRLSEWLKAAYADVLKYVDPAIDDEVKIRDAFRSYNPVGQQPRMVTLFLGLSSAAGMGPEKQAGQSRRARPPTQSPRKQSAPAQNTNNGSAADKQETEAEPTRNPPAPPLNPYRSEKALEYRLVDLMSEAVGDTEVMGAIIKVITFLKTKDAKEPAKPYNEAGGRGDK